MVDLYVQIKIRKSTKDKLDSIRKALQNKDELENLRISYDYIVNRNANTFFKLK